MFYHFLYPLKDYSIVFNLFRYITFRAAAASVTAFLISLWLGPRVIRMLKRINATAHNRREHAQAIHGFYSHKDQVPTMGGILIVMSVVISVLLWTDLTNSFIQILLSFFLY